MKRPPIKSSTSVRFNRRHPVHSTTHKQSSYIGLVLGCLGFWLLPTLGTTRPVLAAERIYASYAVLERSISVDALENYARAGKVDEDLAVYAQYLKPQQMTQLRGVLLSRIDLSPVAVSQFLYTDIGETLLQRLAEVIQTESRQPGFYALRAALILAADDPQGLTLLNLLRKFPTRSIRIDLTRSLEIAGELERIINQTNRAIAFVNQQSDAQTTTPLPKFDLSESPDLRRLGRYRWKKETQVLYDLPRSRVFSADIYLPLKLQRPAPVVVISHGLGSNRTSFRYLATHLASYGFAVAVPDHPGSDAEQLRALLAGRASEVTEPSEFIDRPLDVKYLLDQLERLDQSDPSIKLNMQQVGVIGQSFGGYTALALAGASLNFEQLKTDCEAINDSWNASLLLQCRAVNLPQTQSNFRDERIKAAIAINPVTSSIFGASGISKVNIPIMIVSGSADTIAPALSEQILPFTQLSDPEKYLVMIQGATHFSAIGPSEPNTDAVSIPPALIGPDSALARRYISALSVAFCQTYVAGNQQYLSYLSPSYISAISSPPLDLSFLQSLSETQVTQAINNPNTNAPTP